MGCGRQAVGSSQYVLPVAPERLTDGPDFHYQSPDQLVTASRFVPATEVPHRPTFLSLRNLVVPSLQPSFTCCSIAVTSRPAAGVHTPAVYLKTYGRLTQKAQENNCSCLKEKEEKCNLSSCQTSARRNQAGATQHARQAWNRVSACLTVNLQFESSSGLQP